MSRDCPDCHKPQPGFETPPTRPGRVPVGGVGQPARPGEGFRERQVQQKFEQVAYQSIYASLADPGNFQNQGEWAAVVMQLLERSQVQLLALQRVLLQKQLITEAEFTMAMQIEQQNLRSVMQQFTGPDRDGQRDEESST